MHFNQALEETDPLTTTFLGLYTILNLDLTRKKKTGLITFDTRKAFDKVSHKKLVKNLAKINCPAYLLN